MPRYPGVTSALGCVIADMRFDKEHTINSMLEDLDVKEVVSEIKRTAEDGQKRLIVTLDELASVVGTIRERTDIPRWRRYDEKSISNYYTS